MDKNEYTRKRKMLYKVPFIVSVSVLLGFIALVFLDAYLAIFFGTIVIGLGIYRSFINFPLSIYGLKKIKNNMKTNYYEKIEGKYENIFHIVLAPAYKEDNENFYEQIVLSTKKSKISENIAVVFVLEQSDENAHRIVKNLMKEHRNVFMVIHPPEKGVIRAKGPADTYAAKLIASIRYNRPFEIPPEANFKTRKITEALISDLKPLIKNKEIVIHSIDIDMFYPRTYFEYFTYAYLKEKNRKNAIFENVIALVNNLDRVGSFSRNIGIFTTYTSIANNMFSLLHTSFASYALSLDLLDRVGYWRTDVIQDDSSIYWSIRTKLGRKNMKYVPLLMPVFGNAIKSEISWAHEFSAQWKQLQRWGMGTADIADIWLSNAPITEKLSALPWWINNHIFWETGGFIGLVSLILSMETGILILPFMAYMISYILTLFGMSVVSKILEDMSYRERLFLFGSEDTHEYVERFIPAFYEGAYPIHPENKFPAPITSAFATTALFVVGESSKKAIIWIDIGYIAALNISSFCALHGAYKAFKYELKFFVSPK